MENQNLILQNSEIDILKQELKQLFVKKQRSYKNI